MLFIQHLAWISPVTLSWSNHLVFATFQCNWTYVLLFLYASFLVVSTLTMHFSSVGSFDFSTTLLNFFVWLWLMCLSNNLLTFIFFLEVLSASVTLTLITSTFSSATFYNNISYDKASYLAESSPLAFLQTLMFFFWATLVTSLTLFLMLIVLYIRFFTLDWSLFGSLNTFLISTSSLKQLFIFAFCWTLFITCVFMKCGVAPFYLWKPVLFRGVSILTLFFYSYVYYFALFFYFIYVSLTFMNEIFCFNVFVLVWFLIVGSIVLSALLFESFYLKSFLAVSSLLNSTFVLYAALSLGSVDLIFFI
jgi:hypothetical protein